MEECIFCKIVRGESPARVVYQDEDVLAFDDISPQAPIHTLVIPKRHFVTLSDGLPTELLGKLMAAVDVVAGLKGVRESGYRLIVNNGRHAKQSVLHLHLHVLGGKQMSHRMIRFEEES